MSTFFVLQVRDSLKGSLKSALRMLHTLFYFFPAFAAESLQKIIFTRHDCLGVSPWFGMQGRGREFWRVKVSAGLSGSGATSSSDLFYKIKQTQRTMARGLKC